jgi:lipopolysaccharide/colanic/teichoic acid biosynthesis glycosyltransferase
MVNTTQALSRLTNPKRQRSIMPSRIPASFSRGALHLTLYDAATAAAAPALAILTRGENDFPVDSLPVLTYWMVAFLLTIAVLTYSGVGAELRHYCAPTDVQKLLTASVGAVVLTVAIIFAINRVEGIARTVPFLHCAYLFAGCYIPRIFLRSRNLSTQGSLRSSEGRTENLLLVGTGDLAWFFTQVSDTLPGAPPKIVGILDTHHGTRGRTLGGYPVIGGYDIVGDALDEFRVHGVIIKRVVVADSTINPSSEPWAVLEQACSARDAKVEFLPDYLKVPIFLSNHSEKGFEGSGTIVVPGGAYWKAKRAIDVVASIILLLLIAPLFAIIALLVGLSVGRPVIFWQERVGQHGRTICVHKFRSMLDSIDEKGRIRSIEERETRVGQFLRATRLDELPQLFDILVGDMSFIGPRPLLPHDQPADSRRRLSVRPGLTGWAQVNGGKLISPEQKSVLDHWYIDHASFRLDIRILVLTIVCVVLGDRSYTTDHVKRHVFRA